MAGQAVECLEQSRESEVEGVEVPKKTESKVEAPAEGLEQSREEEVPAAEVKEEKKEEPAV